MKLIRVESAGEGNKGFEFGYGSEWDQVEKRCCPMTLTIQGATVWGRAEVGAVLLTSSGMQGCVAVAAR